MASPVDVAGGDFALVVVGQSGTVVPLPADRAIVIGRDEDCDVVLSDVEVSRRHAQVRGGETVTVEDLGSQNGSFLHELARGPDVSQFGTAAGNVLRLQPGRAVTVVPGNRIRVGSTVLAVVRQAREPAAQAKGPELPIVLEPAMVKVYQQATQVGSADISVLILGETGVGKDVMASVIHRHSRRRQQPMLRLNCAAFTESLLESELFGHEKGAFTGAVAHKAGLLESASGGTIFLDEIGEVSPAIQAKLLRVIEGQELFRVGSVRPTKIDLRFIAATNRDLKREADAGRFRSDLYFRLAGAVLTVPPLRERRSEIIPLAKRFLTSAAARWERVVPVLDPSAERALLAHAWPGNVRELRHAIERALLLGPGDRIGAEHFALDSDRDSAAPALPRAATATAAPSVAAAPPTGDLRQQMEDLERQQILQALEDCAGNQTYAAAKLGMPRRTFISKLEKYDVKRPRKRS